MGGFQGQKTADCLFCQKGTPELNGPGQTRNRAGGSLDFEEIPESSPQMDSLLGLSCLDPARLSRNCPAALPPGKSPKSNDAHQPKGNAAGLRDNLNIGRDELCESHFREATQRCQIDNQLI